ncbi:MAG: HTH domain-containing protein [Cyclobacteriaceae bacterium]|nr:HTH domain-containing protein [Cyclobacteriaceae bacterium]
MDFLTYSERLEYILSLIEKGFLQSPNYLVEKYNISERTARRMISSLRMLGHDVVYCKKTKKYFLRNKQTAKN